MEVVKAQSNASIKVTAVNSAGEAQCSASLTISQKEDFRARLKQCEHENILSLSQLIIVVSRIT